MEEVVRDSYSHDSWLFFGTFCVGLSILRYVQIQLLQTLSRSKYAEKRRITKAPIINDKQLERESVWPQGFVIDLAVMFLAFYFDCFKGMEMFQWKAFFVQIIIHATVVEFTYYWFHRALHVGWLFKKFHAYHHASINTEPTTSLSFELGERILFSGIIAISPTLSYYLGYQSFITMGIQILLFDLQNAIGHLNFEFLPPYYYENIFSYLWYSPTYHSIHHTRISKNFALFMPWTDLLFGTGDRAKTIDVFNQTIDQVIPDYNAQQLIHKDFGFVLHAVELPSYYHSSTYYPCCGLSNKQYVPRWWMPLALPLTIITYIYHSYFHKGYHLEDEFDFDCGVDEHGNPRILHGQTFIVHNPAMDYIIPWKFKQINRRITKAILDAQHRNVGVTGLAALNKAEWLNHGGADLVRDLGDQLTRTVVTHGDTLTSAVVLQNILSLRARNYWNHSVFMIGATSKIGRVVCLALATRRIKVYMFTQSAARFKEIRDELTDEHAEYLVQCTKLSEGEQSDLWITGKYEPSGKELIGVIPRNTTVLNFAVPDPLTPKLLRQRPDIVHLDGGFLAYDVKKTSMYFSLLLPPGMMYSCMVGCIVHAALKLKHCEIGPVKLEELDLYWENALKCGFFLPRPTSFLQPLNLPEKRIMEV